MRRLAYILIFLPLLAYGAVWEPVGFTTVEDLTSPVHLRNTSIGGSIWAYPVTSAGDTAWIPVANDWDMTRGDTCAVSMTDLIKTTVYLKGDSLGWVVSIILWADTLTTIKQKATAIGVVNVQSGQPMPIPGTGSFVLGSPTVDGNIISFPTGLGGVRLNIVKENGSISKQIVFESAYLTQAVSTFLNLPPPAQQNFRLYNLWATYLNGVENPTFTGSVYERKLRNIGRGWELTMPAQQLQYEGSDSAYYPVLQFWGSATTQREQVPMANIAAIHNANPNTAITHNTSTIIGDTYIEDCYIYSSGANTNTGIRATGVVATSYSGTSYKWLQRIVNLQTALGANQTITAAGDSNKTTGTIAGSCPIGLYRVYKTTIEGTSDNADPNTPSGGGGATWNDRDADPSEWGKVACDSLIDGGSDNNNDGFDCDREVTAKATTTTSATFTWYTWNLTAAFAQAIYDGTNNGSMIFVQNGGISGAVAQFYSQEATGTTNDGRFYFTHETAAGGAAPAPSQVIMME